MAAMASKFNFECVIQYYTDQWYSVYQKKLYPLKFKLSRSYCSNLTALTAPN